MPRRDDVVPRYVLERNAREAPEDPMASFPDGSTWTWSEGLAQAYRAAGVLRSQGVRQGDHVAVFLPNGADFVRAWLGVTFLGATMVPLNPALKGTLLVQALGLTAPRVAVSTGDFATRLSEADPALGVLEPGALTDGPAAPPELETPIEPWHTHHFQYTSGTTGPSRAARCSYLQFYLTGSWATVEVGSGPDDVWLIDLPLFHASALSMANASFTTRTPIAVTPAPAMTNYFEVARDTGATIGFLLSSMAGFLLSRPVSPAESEHRLRLLISAPLPPDPEAFMKRFNVPQIITAYGSSEVSGALYQNRADVPLVAGSCGRPRDGYRVRLVDDNDLEVPVGRPGQLVVRTDVPWMLSTEYVGNPESTAAAWRNGWFHTGDLLRVDENGDYFVVDRVKDALRRRGENISTFEVEREVLTYPGVAEVACVGVAAAGADHDVKIFVVPKPDQQIDFSALVKHLVDRMPHFMVPRYYELIDALPKTPSMRVQKYLLRDRGNTESTWDIEVDGGQRITRDGLKPV